MSHDSNALTVDGLADVIHGSADVVDELVMENEASDIPMVDFGPFRDQTSIQ